MAVSEARPTFAEPNLQAEINRLRRVDNHTNLMYLAVEYMSLLVVIGGAVLFAEYRGTWGLAWAWNVPVFVTAIILIGGLQHRLAGLGHESSHYSFMRNRFLNDLIPDLFCMFPLMTTVHFYRLFHLGHHQFTNDPERDPDLLNLGHGKRAGDFPMSRSRFITKVYFAFIVAPLRFLQYQWAYMKVNTLGLGRNVYMDRVGAKAQGSSGGIRLATALGIAYIAGLYFTLRRATAADRVQLVIPLGLAGIALLAVVIHLLPDWAMYRSPLRQVYSTRFVSLLRMCFYTVLIVALAQLRWYTAGRSAIYPVLLWFVPLGTSFTFFMFLRDVYQHSNADDGRLTNSRVFFTDFFTRWAVLVYGQDMHIPHHLFPAVPHYRLGQLHALLKEEHEDYRSRVVETHGTFRDSYGRTTILDEMTRPRHESAHVRESSFSPKACAARDVTLKV
jgi:fatty acid desaturase